MDADLRSDEVLACVHRVALSRGAPFEFQSAPIAPEMERRRRSAREHRREVLTQLSALHADAARPRSENETVSLLRQGVGLLLSPRLPADEAGRRRASVQALVRVGRVDQDFTYAPILIKNHEVVEAASTRRTLQGTLTHLRPTEARFVDGVGVRSGPSMTRSGLALAHATRVLEALSHADTMARGAIVDRQDRLWWFELGGDSYPRFNLQTYDHLYEERVGVLLAHDAWVAGEGPFPTAPYWHRDCPECPFAEKCEEQLAANDDVSLVRFTSLDQQLVLREHGVTTRAQLARLDPALARQSRHAALNPLDAHRPEEVLGRSIDKLDDLIYRARVRRTRLVPARRGRRVRRRAPPPTSRSTSTWRATTTRPTCGGRSSACDVDVPGLTTGYRSFVEWGELGPESETRVFAEFWAWLSDVRDTCRARGLTFAAYCFWAAAEDGAMNRAVAHPLGGGPRIEDLLNFRRADPPEWIDVHDVAKRQIQTDGPLGLKQLASATGFRWRDDSPSGEASMVWYEVATRDDSPAALASRERIVAYNEDDCRATKALRDWLNGPARLLAHRDDPPETP